MTSMDRFEALERESMLLGRHMAPVRHYKVERRLERSGYTLLTRIQAEGAMSIAELSDGLGLDMSTLNRQTAVLVKAGLLERVADPDGGVARKFQITTAGEADLAYDRDLNVTGLRSLLAEWDSTDIDQFVALMRRFNTEIEVRVGQSWPREDA